MFKSKKLLPLLATLSAFSWGCAYPLIKLGLIQFQIDNNDTGGKALFAGIRFTIAGLVVLLIALLDKRKMRVERKSDFGWLFLFAIVNTTLHYFFFYIGVSNSHGSRASILNSLGTFMLVFLACIFFKEEHLTTKKLVGCAIGFAGIILLNVGGGTSGEFTLSGDGMIIMNAICAAFGGIITRIISKKMDILAATGVSLSLGGILLVICGSFMGGAINALTLKGCIILFLLVCVSAVSFSIYNQLMQNHPVGQVAIYNAFIPVFGVLLSCIFLGEPFSLRYIVAGLLVSGGVFVLNYKK